MKKTEENFVGGKRIVIEFEGADTSEVRAVVESQINALFYLIRILESKE